MMFRLKNRHSVLFLLFVLMGSLTLRGANPNSQEVVLSEGDRRHVRLFSRPDNGEVRILTMKVENQHSATGKIPGGSGWSLEDGHENCMDSEPGSWSFGISRCGGDCPVEVAIGFTNSPTIDVETQFVTTITGEISSCTSGTADDPSSSSEPGGGGDTETFTLLITDEVTAHILPNPASVEVSTDDEDHWVKLRTIRYGTGDSEVTEIPVIVDWSHEMDVNLKFAASEGGSIMNQEQLNEYESEYIWVKSHTANDYAVKCTTVSGSVDITGVLKICSIAPTKIVANNRNGLAKIHLTNTPSVNISNISLRLLFGTSNVELGNWDVSLFGNFTVPFNQKDIVRYSWLEEGVLLVTATTVDGLELQSSIDVTRDIQAWLGNDTYYKIYTWGDTGLGGTLPVVATMRLTEVLDVVDYSVPFEGFDAFHQKSTLLISNISPHPDGGTGADSAIINLTHKIYDKDGEVIHESGMGPPDDPVIIGANSKYRELKPNFWFSSDNAGHAEAKLTLGWWTLNGYILPIPHISPLQDNTVEAAPEEAED